MKSIKDTIKDGLSVDEMIQLAKKVEFWEIRNSASEYAQLNCEFENIAKGWRHPFYLGNYQGAQIRFHEESESFGFMKDDVKKYEIRVIVADECVGFANILHYDPEHGRALSELELEIHSKQREQLEVPKGNKKIKDKAEYVRQLLQEDTINSQT